MGSGRGGGIPSETEAIQLLHAAVDAGIDFFDTARMYGRSEVIMGKAFEELRKNLVISTKCRHFKHPDGSLPSGAAMEGIIRESLQESLAALRTDYIDVFMLHQADLAILAHEEIAAVFTALKQEGVIRATGVSTYLPEESSAAIEAGVWDVIQLPFNLLDQRQGALFDQAAERGVGIVIRSVLLKGLLSDSGRDLHPALREVEAQIQTYAELTRQLSCDLPTLATRFALSYEAVSAVLVGIDRPEYLQRSLAAANGVYLDEATLSRVEALAYPDPEFLNLHSWSLKGWLV